MALNENLIQTVSRQLKSSGILAKTAWPSNLCVLTISVLVAEPCLAQSAVPTATVPIPVVQILDVNGVDLYSRKMIIAHDPLVIAPGQPQELSYQKVIIGANWSDSLPRFEVAQDWQYGSPGAGAPMIKLCEDPFSGLEGAQVVTLSIFGHSESFVACGGSAYVPTSSTRYVSTLGNGSRLVYDLNTNIYAFTKTDGTVARFGSVQPDGTTRPASPILLDIVNPAGKKTTVRYRSDSWFTKDFETCVPDALGEFRCPSNGKVHQETALRIEEIVNNYGFAIKFDYVINDAANFKNMYKWKIIVKASTFNMSKAGTPLGWQIYQEDDFTRQAGSGNPIYKKSATDPENQKTEYTWTMYSHNGTYPRLSHIQRPGRSAPNVVISYDPIMLPDPYYGVDAAKVSSVSADGVLSNYRDGMTVTTPAGETKYIFDNRLRRMVSTTDPLNKTSNWQYDSIGRVTEYTKPEGNKEIVRYDDFGNADKSTRRAKVGSSLPDIDIFATYWTGSPTVRNRPSTITDGRGNVSAYSYDPTHGGVTLETGPAVAQVSPQTRHEYVQRNAWVRSGGGYVRADSPVWVESRTAACRMTAAVAGGCAGGAADEVVTQYDYGPDDGTAGNNLLLRGKVVTAQDGDGVIRSYRTCFGYDAVGNKIWETRPRADLNRCQ